MFYPGNKISKSVHTINKIPHSLLIGYVAGTPWKILFHRMFRGEYLHEHREDSEATKNMAFSVVSTRPGGSFTQFCVFNQG